MTVYENIYSLFAERFPSDRRAPFIDTPAGGHYSYGDLERESARYARFLTGLGLQPGDRVAVQIEKSPAALFLYLGCLRAGLIYLPLNPACLAFIPDEINRTTKESNLSQNRKNFPSRTFTNEHEIHEVKGSSLFQFVISNSGLQVRMFPALKSPTSSR